MPNARHSRGIAGRRVAVWLVVCAAAVGCRAKGAASSEEEVALDEDAAADDDLTFADVAIDVAGDAKAPKPDTAADVPDAPDATDSPHAPDAVDAEEPADVAEPADVVVPADVPVETDAGQTDAAALDAAPVDVPDVAPDVPVDVGPPVCTSAQLAACDDGNPCTDDACDPVTGCSHVANLIVCDDGSVCTESDVCTGGTCVGTDVSCDDQKPCTTDTCKPGFGCLHQNAAGPCDDGNPCTAGEACKIGLCLGGQAIDCGDGQACTLDLCDPSDGACSHVPTTGNCSDDDPCTVGESCAGGACAGGQPAVCDDGNPCTSDTCAPAVGCVFAADVTGTCDDGIACTAGDACADGLCAGTPLVCLPSDACHAAGVCNPSTGTCPSVNAVDGTVCTDGLACTTGDQCVGGACTGVSTCDDHDACTLDVCGPGGACVQTPVCTVGGVVVGLGPGSAPLQLQSGVHTAVVAADGPFTLSGTLPNGTPYFVVRAQPLVTTPRCQIVHGAGEVAGASVTNVLVTCGACGDGTLGPDPVVDLRFEWQSASETPTPVPMTCTVNQQVVLTTDAASPDFYCDEPAQTAHVTDATTLALLQAGPNAIGCQTNGPVAISWLVVTAVHASGRTASAVLFDNPGDAGALTDAVKRNTACPGFGDLPAGDQATLTVTLVEACDDANSADGDGCSALCQDETACVPGQDSDGDGLDDCVETGTGQFLDTQHTGTSPSLWDTDADGLGDGDEVLGTAQGLDLPALGALPLRQDVFVEVDWMEESAECPNHSHQLTAASAALAEAMYAAAPRVNPDGSTGIALHLDYGQGGVWTGGNHAGAAVEFPPDIGPDLAAVKAKNFAPNRLGIFHYALNMHSLGPTAGGIGELVGDDFILASGGCDTCYNCQGLGPTGHLYAEVLVHELGHNLGLRHGGNEDCNGKGNYASVMNYRHAYFGIDAGCDDVPDGVLDYARGSRPPIDEAKLDEAQGVCGGLWLDWNKNKAVDAGVKKDLNPDFNPTCGGTFTVHHDNDDWTQVTMQGLNQGYAQPGPVAGASRMGQRALVCYDDPATVAKRRPVVRPP